MSTNDRVKKLRHTLGISQAKFANDILVSAGYVAGIELGNRRVNERISKLICMTYGVNRIWLEKGEGEMFLNDSKAELAGDIFSRLRPDYQEYALQQLERLLDLQSKS